MYIHVYIHVHTYTYFKSTPHAKDRHVREPVSADKYKDSEI